LYDGSPLTEKRPKSKNVLKTKVKKK
jgi:hypothetical protein